MKNIAIIPARSGSKGLIHKNIMPLRGMPLMVYSIEVALQSGLFDTVMVSTDSDEYAEIARSYGADVPVLRSQKNSTDTAGSWDVVKEVLDYYKAQGVTFDNVCLLQPTSPLRTAEDIHGAYKLFLEKDAVSVVSVCKLEHPLTLAGYLPESGSLNGFVERKTDIRRQCQQQAYRLNGAVYFVKTAELYADSFIFRDGCYAYVMSREHSADIDSLMDFRYAEFLLNCRDANGE